MPAEKLVVLIAEDSPTQRLQLALDLSDRGFEVLVAEDGQQAWDLAKSHRVDVVISDIVMPNVDGYELTRRLMDDAATSLLPVILLTSLSERRDVINGLQAGADSFVTKPYSIDFLLEQIDYLVRNKALREETSPESMEINFDGEVYTITSRPRKVVDLLLSTYENAVKINADLSSANVELSTLKNTLEEKNARLEELDRTKNQFLGMAAHDLRNPLGVIKGYCELLIGFERYGLGEEAKSILRKVVTSSHGMLELVNELLDISVIESGELKLALEPIDLSSTLADAIELQNLSASEKDITLDFTPPSGGTVSADYGKLLQVFTNLISNAIKYSEPGTTVRIGIARDAGDVIVTVADEGQGIPADEVANLFQPFGTTSVRATAGEKSTGLGLAIVLRIVEAHGGTIEVDSEVGVGTSFRVRLPVHDG